MPDASRAQAVHLAVRSLSPGTPAVPAVGLEHVRESPVHVPELLEGVRKLPELAQGNSVVHEALEPPLAPAALAVAWELCRYLLVAWCRRFAPEAAKAVPARPLKAWESSRSPAKAPGLERLWEWQAARPFPEPPASRDAPPNIPARNTDRTPAKGQRRFPVAQSCLALPRYRVRAPRVPQVPQLPVLRYQSIRASTAR